MGDLLGSPRVAPLIFIFFPSISVRLLFEKSKRSRDGGSREAIRNEKHIAENWRRNGKIRAFKTAERAGKEMLRRIIAQNATGAIIPALMHRIPSELRS